MGSTKIFFTGRKEICDNTYSFTFNLYESEYEFKAGQYAYFTIMDPVHHDPNGNSRPLSFANSPHHVNSLMVASRKNQSVFVENLLSLSPGSELQISDPEGEVDLHSEADVENIFIAGGIGVTPVRSIVEFATENNLKNRISLFYSNRSLSNSAFFSDFLKWTDENENFRLIPFFEKAPDAGLKFESGRIDSEILKKYLGNFKNKNFNILGPPEMVDSIRSMILKENVSEDKIKTERF